MCGGKVEPVNCPAPRATTTSPYPSQTGSRGAAQSRTKSHFQAHVLRPLPQGKLRMSLRIPGAMYLWGETGELLGFYGEEPRAVQSGKMCSHCADKERPSACCTELFLEAWAPYWKALMGGRVRGRLGKTAGWTPMSILPLLWVTAEARSSQAPRSASKATQGPDAQLRSPTFTPPAALRTLQPA